MKNLKNPILKFKESKQLIKKDSKTTFDIRLGLSLNSDKSILIETDKELRKHCATLITETREAVDSSENS